MEDEQRATKTKIVKKGTSEDVIFITKLGLENFRKFEQFEWTHIKRTHAIMGANGVGKTTLLWSLLLFCRGYNLLVTNPKRQSKTKNLFLSEVAQLLNYPPLKDYPLSLFFPRRGGEKVASSISCTLGTENFKCLINYDNTLTITPTPDEIRSQKIKYVFVGVDSSWVGLPSEELGAVDLPLTSGVSNTRARYAGLSDPSKEMINKHMKSLLNIKMKLEPDNYVSFIENDGPELEIIFAGAACKKIFMALVLLYTLVEEEGKTKLYLIEEPEVQLYPKLHQSFILILKQVCENRGIQFISTSNASLTMNLFSPQNIFVLQPNGTGCNLTDHHWLRDAIHLHILGAVNKSVKSVLICEGKDDHEFLPKLAEMFNFDLSRDFTIIPSHGRTSHVKLALEMLNKLSPNSKNIALVVDRDFRIDPLKDRALSELHSIKKDGVALFYWDLPAIESYLFVHLVMIGELDIENLRTPEALEKLTTSFINGFSSQNKDVNFTDPSFIAGWKNVASCMELLHKGPPYSLQELKKIALLIHGHTWVEDILHTTTADLLSKMTPTIVEHLPELGDFFKSIKEWGRTGKYNPKPTISWVEHKE